MHPQKYDSVCYQWVSRENLDYKRWAVYGSDDSNKQSYTFTVLIWYIHDVKINRQD